MARPHSAGPWTPQSYSYFCFTLRMPYLAQWCVCSLIFSCTKLIMEASDWDDTVLASLPDDSRQIVTAALRKAEGAVNQAETKLAAAAVAETKLLQQNTQLLQQNTQLMQQNAQLMQQNTGLLREQARVLEFGEDASTVVREAVATLLLSGRYDEANELAARADQLEAACAKCRERRANMLVQHHASPPDAKSTSVLTAMQVGTTTGAAGHKSKHSRGTASWTERCTGCNATSVALEGCRGMDGGSLPVLVEGYFHIGLLKCVV